MEQSINKVLRMRTEKYKYRPFRRQNKVIMKYMREFTRIRRRCNNYKLNGLSTKTINKWLRAMSHKLKLFRRWNKGGVHTMSNE